MVPPAVGVAGAVLFVALIVDRLIGDPHSVLHPVALLGRFIGWWGRPALFPVRLQRAAGVFFWVATTLIFALPFFLFGRFTPWLIYLVGAPFLLKCCFAWRSLEEHTHAVLAALQDSVEEGRERVKMLVSRDTARLGPDQIRSAAYESMTENLTDSIISPLFYFSLFGLVGAGLVGAAVFRAANTMDAMLGYRDERVRIGWCAARMDDLFNYIPSRITVVLLLGYFVFRGTSRRAWRMMWRDGKRRLGFNGGIVMAAMAGGCGVRFIKPGIYEIGNGERTLEEGGSDILRAVRAVALAFALIAGGTLILLAWVINSTFI